MGQHFLFVDGMQGDSASKKLARRHVMKGKNAGKTIHRPSRRNRAILKQRLAAIGRQDPSSTEDSYFQDDSSPVASGWIARGFGNGFLGSILPVDASADSPMIINQFVTITSERLYPARLGIKLDRYKKMWLPLMFGSDEGSIALMQACNQLYAGDGQSTSLAMYHLSKTYEKVKSLINGPAALSDSTIGIVVSLIVQEQIRNEYAGALAHAGGLNKMIQLRGGLSRLEECPALLMKICKTDIALAIHSGGPTRYFRDYLPHARQALAEKGLRLKHHVNIASLRHRDLDPYLCSIAVDAMGISALFNDNLPGMALEITIFQEIQFSLCYRLLRFCPLRGTRQMSPVSSAYHIGLVLFVMSMFLQFDHRRILDYECALSRWKSLVMSEDYNEESEIRLWLLLIGGMWMTCPRDESWFTTRIRQTVHRLDARTWDEFKEIAGRFPWIDALHDEPTRALWDDIQPSQFEEGPDNCRGKGKAASSVLPMLFPF